MITEFRSATSLVIRLADEKEMQRLGADLALALRVGDVLALTGDLGTGKTTLSRALIRALANDPELEVPSPTYTLVQDYELRLPIVHVDLYRLGDADEIPELGLDEASARGVLLVEWAERAEGDLPGNQLEMLIEHAGDGRRVTFSAADEELLARFARTLAIRDFLVKAGEGEAERVFLMGDASTRAYEIVRDTQRPERILMDAPRRPDGPAIRDGKPYSQIAHLAESVTPFVAIADYLRAQNIASPIIYAQDLERGLLLMEHLGPEHFLVDGKPVAERYCEAARLLAQLHRADLPGALEVEAGIYHHVPDYDRVALSIEVELLTDWYMPSLLGRQVRPEEKQAYLAAWSKVFDHLDQAEKHIVLRDYHSPNLIWRSQNQGLDRLGVIDFQDAVIGPSAYDLASLAMDARVDISPELERETFSAYCAAREASGPFDAGRFEEAYAIMAAQRNAKILGIFVRLNVRDGKPGYLRHLPRIRDYFQRSLTHEALTPIREFVEEMGLFQINDAA